MFDIIESKVGDVVRKGQYSGIGAGEMKGRTPSRFSAIEKIGQGGMGVVWKVRDNQLGRTVALKFLSHVPDNAEAKKRFEQEARAAAALNHPNIVTIHDINLIKEPMYIVMEYVEG